MNIRDAAVGLIMYKMRTRKELVEKLVQKGYDKEAAEVEADFMVELGYIDERDYARRYVHDATTVKGHGARRIKSYLKLKGIPSHIIENVMEEELSDMPDILRSLVEKKIQGVDLSVAKNRNKIINYFINRGFSYSDIKEYL